MCKVIAIVNQKGGVGKTTTTVNLGVALANLGKKVLLIDADSQGSLSISLGCEDPDQIDITLTSIIQNLISSQNDEDEHCSFNADYAIIHHEEGVDFIPSNIDLSNMEITLVNALSRELILKDYIDKIKDFYDFILIDSMPSLGMLTLNVLTSVNSVLIPVIPQYLPTKGLNLLLNNINRIKRKLNPKIKIEGILLTMVDIRSNYTKDIINLINTTYGDKINIFPSYIPLTVRASESSTIGKSIFKHDPKSKAALAYIDLAKEIINNGI